MNELLRPLLDEAERDPNVVGVLLKGSRALGTADEESDWDVVIVLASGEPSHAREGFVDVVRTTIDRVRGTSSYERPALAHARVLLDKRGEVQAAVDALTSVTRDEIAELYDSYLNDFYRSLKAWRRRQELAARLSASRSVWWLGELVFAVEGRRAPYPSAWKGRLRELEPLMLDVARSGDPRTQQKLQSRVERIAREHGLHDVYDAWDGEIDRVMRFEF